MKVWVLCEDFGCDGFDIVGIYSTADNAESVRAERRRDNDRVEEWELDLRMGWKHGPVFFVSTNARTGSILSSRESEHWRDPSDSGAYCPYDYCTYVASNGRSAVSMEHAVELARAAAAKWLEEQKP